MSEKFIRFKPNLWVTQSPLYATNSGVFISNRQACLIDPGIAPHKLDALAAFLKKKRAVPRALIITHAHWDHMMGAEKFPNVPVITHVAYADVLKAHGDDLKQQIAKWEKHNHIRRDSPFKLPQATYSFNQDLRLAIGKLTLRLLPIPGHTPDQIAVYHAESGTLWAADILSECELPMVMGSLDAYEDTLARLAQLDVRVLIPGHGTPTTEVAEIQARFMQDRAYLAELRACVSHAIAEGMTHDEAIADCDAISFAQPAENITAHRWNIASCFVALGGEAEGHIGWEQDWDA